MTGKVYVPATTRQRMSIMDALALLVISSLIPAAGYASTWQVWQ